MRKLLILLAVFLGLLAFAYFYQIEGEKTRQEAKEREESVFKGLKSDEVTAIEVGFPDRDPLQMVRLSPGVEAGEIEGEQGTEYTPRKKAHWRLESPLAAKADSGSVEFLLERMAEAKIERLLKAKGQGPAEYGLDNPRLTLSVHGGDQDYKLLLGKDGFGGQRIYAQLQGSPDVYLTAKSLFTQADKPVEEWRDKDVLEFESTEVEAIEIERPAGKLRFSRQDDRWKLEEPLQEEADQQQTGGILSSLDLAKIEEFAPDPKNLSAYGLDQPQIRLRIRQKGEEEWKSIELGARREDGKYWARDLSRPEVFAVGGDLPEKLTRELWDFRGKQVIDIDQDKIAQVRLVRPTGEVVVEKKDYQWTIQSPEEQKGKETYSYKFWYPLENIKFTSLDESGAPFPESSAEITVTLEDGSSRRYQFACQSETCRAKNLQTGRQGQISQEDCNKLDVPLGEIVG